MCGFTDKCSRIGGKFHNRSALSDSQTVAIFASLLFFAGQCFAQTESEYDRQTLQQSGSGTDTSDESRVSDVAGSSKRLFENVGDDTLVAQSGGTTTAAAKQQDPPATEGKGIDFDPTVSLFTRFHFDGYYGDAGATDSTESTFMVRRARIGFRGKLLSNLEYNYMAALDAGNSETVGSEVKKLNMFANFLW